MTSRVSLVLVGMVSVACSSSDPAPPPAPSGPLFTEAFDGAEVFPAGWDSVSGDVTVIDAPDAPSGPRVMRAQSLTTGPKDALAQKSLRATRADVLGLTCTFSVKLVKFAGDTHLTVGRLDVGGGAVLFDMKPDEWHFFGRFGAQEIADGGKAPVLGAWAVVTITIEKTGNVVVKYNGEQRIKRVDVNGAPLDATRGALELGLASPPGFADSEALYDDVVCTMK